MITDFEYARMKEEDALMDAKDAMSDKDAGREKYWNAYYGQEDCDDEVFKRDRQ